MRDQANELQRRLGVWLTIQAGRLPRFEPKTDDKGAVSVETAIVTALLGTAAAALGVFITARITGWRARIPAP